MDKKRFKKFVQDNFAVLFPAFRYLEQPLARINTGVDRDGPFPIIANSEKFNLGATTGYWHSFNGIDSTHAAEKAKREREDTWIEGENHVYFNEYRYVLLRDGGTYGLMLYLLSRDRKLLFEFCDLGIALGTREFGVDLGGYHFEVFPSVGDLFLLSVVQPDLFPDLAIDCPSRVLIRGEVEGALQNHLCSIFLDRD